MVSPDLVRGTEESSRVRAVAESRIEKHRVFTSSRFRRAPDRKTQSLHEFALSQSPGSKNSESSRVRAFTESRIEKHRVFTSSRFHRVPDRKTQSLHEFALSQSPGSKNTESSRVRAFAETQNDKHRLCAHWGSRGRPA